MQFMSLWTKKIIYTLIWVIGGFLLVFNIFPKNEMSKTSLIFTYPKWTLDFAWEPLPDLNQNYFVKERFDKEFLNTSYNLYQFFLYIKRLPLYMPYIQSELRENNIPLDFQYLPIAESALRNDVVSTAGAWWIWQFMPETAKEYWLIVNDQIDERYNFEKSTDAAMRYLSYLHTLFDDWTLVAASYNRGQNGIARALETQQVDNYYDLYLNEETSRYVFRILAIKYVLQDYYSKKSSIDSVIWWQYLTPKTQVIEVWKIDNLESWAKEIGQNYQVVKNLNQWILGNSLPEGNWEVTVLDK